jgi:hypothetical protein
MKRFFHWLPVLVLLFAARSFAQDWSITTSDFHTRPGVPLSLSAAEVRMQFPGLAEDNTVLLNDFVSLQRAASDSATPAKFTLALQGGDRLTGEPLKVADEQLLWQSGSLGEMSIPLAHLVALSRGSAAPVAEPPKQDIVTLANGDTVAGVFIDCSPDKVTIRTDTGSTDVPVSTITRIAFASTASSSTAASAHGFRIKLTDGSSITAAEVTLADTQLTFTIDGKPSRKVQIPMAQVTSIEQLNGPISWLSSRTSIQNEQIPYFPGSPIWPAQMDTAADGSPLRFNNQLFKHGIGVHAYSRLTYAIDPGWKSFRTQYAIDSRDDARRPLADITVRIKLDGKTVHEQPHVRAGKLWSVVTIDLNQAKELTLEADYGNAGDTQDHLNWLEPALVR